ncbi:MAG: DsbA family protein [Patescibacteria group bacterium]|nr:DsbA family protein [Patescibacteria group bacterium]MCL5431499.1 DsbA family protein [Patescibacteria group bacterium]
MSTETKIFLGVIIGTLVLIFGAAMMLGNNNGSPATLGASAVSSADQKLLIRPDSWKKGPDNAKVTLVEFSDFECPACQAAEPTVDSLLAKYGNQIQFVYRFFPLPSHPDGFSSAEAAQAAGEQGKFWEMRTKLFTISPSLSQDNLIQAAKDLGLDITKFNQDLDSDATRARVLEDQNDGNSLSVNATPTFFINGARLVGSSGLETAVTSALR